MALGKLLVLGRPTVWMIVGQGPIVLAVGGAGWCGFGHFFLSCIISLFFLPFSGGLKYCLKGHLNQKQPTNQSNNLARCFLIQPLFRHI